MPSEEPETKANKRIPAYNLHILGKPDKVTLIFQGQLFKN